jgi:hypothetical protein
VRVRRLVNRPALPPSDLTAVLADMPDLLAALVRDHVADKRGYCRACGMPGTGTAHLPWPCPLRRIAEAARQFRAGRR